MSYNGSGVFSRPVADYVYDTVISETDMNTEMAGIATGLTNCVTRDGQSDPSADLPMATHKHTGVGNASERNHYAAAGQVQDGSFTWCGTAGGTADAITLFPSPAIPAYAVGQKFRWKSGAASNTGAMTITVSGLMSKAAEINNVALAAGQHEANKYYEGLYDGTAFQIWQVSAASVTGPASATDGSLARFDGTTGKLLKDGAVIGTDVQAHAAVLADLAALTLAQGDTLYFDGTNLNNLGPGTDGQFLQTQGAGANPQWADVVSSLTLGTVQATTSGIVKDFTIPAGVKQITVMINGLSFSGNAVPIIELGDSGGVSTTGYVGSVGTGASYANHSSGFKLTTAAAGADVYQVSAFLTLLDPSTNTWAVHGISGRSDVAQVANFAGCVALSGELTTIRLTSEGGATMDAGKVNVSYI